jgi:hypothetical protein
MRSPLVVSLQPVALPGGRWKRILNQAYEFWHERAYRDGNNLNADTIVMEES